MSNDTPRVLGEGSFGCVLLPPVKCTAHKELFVEKQRHKPKKQTVGKIFYDRQDFETEVAASKKVVRVDPRGKHILIPTSHCETTFGNVTTHPASSECENVRDRMFTKPDTPLYQITMPYGGRRYDKEIRMGTTPFVKFIKQLIHVLEGVQKLQRHKTCHQDLKASNLLIDIDGNVLIIDYSLMMPMTEIYTEKNMHRLRHSYFPYPPEYKIFYLIYKNLCDKDCTIALPQVMKNLEHYGDRRRAMFEDIHGGPSNIKNDVATFYTYAQRLESKGRLVKAFEAYARKVDVYSVGAIMMDMDAYVVKKGVSKSSLDAYRDVMRSMTMIDPRKRGSVTTMLKKLRAIV